MSTIWNWREQAEADSASVEFTVKPHDINDITVHLWIDPVEPSDAEALASLDVTLDDAEKLGNELLAAVASQRGRRARGDTDPAFD